MGEEVKLLGTWASPFSFRIELALKLKGIQYEYIEEDLSNKSPLLLNSNPVHKKVPVLIHNGKSISESLVILDYIDETWQNHPILPKHPYDRAIARFWAKFIEEKILQIAFKFRAAELEEKKLVLEEVGEQLKVLEKELNGKEFFGGEGIGYVDIVAIFIVYWFEVCQELLQINRISEEKFPILWKWKERLYQNELVSEILPPKQKHYDFIRTEFQLQTEKATSN